jgi:hypothetical protein
VTERGEVIQGGFQEGVDPLLADTDEQQMYLNSLTHVKALEGYKAQLGSLKFSMTEHEKVTLMTFPMADGSILCISVTPRAKLETIKGKVNRAIRGSHSGASGKRKTRKALK